MRSTIIAAVMAVLGGCQDSVVSRAVGARCERSSECNDRCLSSAIDYPGGFCTIGCRDRDGCPDDTTCADREGGVCLFMCTLDVDCEFLGAGWRCIDVDLHGGGIKVRVCRGS